MTALARTVQPISTTRANGLIRCRSLAANGTFARRYLLSPPDTHVVVNPAPRNAKAVGDPLLLIQGWACSSSDWGAIPRMLAARSNRPVITYDPCGFGASGPLLERRDTNETIIDDFASEAVEVVISTGYQRAHILGLSFGGMVAQRLGWHSLAGSFSTLTGRPATDPNDEDDDQVGFEPLSMILCSTSLGGPHSAGPAKGFLNTFDGWGSDTNRLVIAEEFLRRAVSSNFAEQHCPVIRKSAQRFADARRDAKAILRQAMVVPCFDGGFDSRTTAEFSRMRFPSMVIHGDSDSIFPLSDAQLLKEHLGPDCRFAVFDDCGHLPYLENPQLFVNVVSEFLKETEAFKNVSA